MFLNLKLSYIKINFQEYQKGFNTIMENYFIMAMTSLRLQTATLFSAHPRNRLFWTEIKLTNKICFCRSEKLFFARRIRQRQRNQIKNDKENQLLNSYLNKRCAWWHRASLTVCINISPFGIRLMRRNTSEFSMSDLASKKWRAGGKHIWSKQLS